MTFDLAGPGGSDQLAVSGAVTLGGGVVFVALSPPAVGRYTLLANTGPGVASPVFAGHPEKSPVTVGGVGYRLSYIGNAGGKDVILDPGGTVTGRVWQDSDKDGIQDGGEPGIPGVVIRLYDASQNLFAETATGSDGLYRFENVPAGDYYLQFYASTDLFFSPPNRGDDNFDSDVGDRFTPATDGRTAVFYLAPGGTIDLDAGQLEF